MGRPRPKTRPKPNLQVSSHPRHDTSYPFVVRWPSPVIHRIGGIQRRREALFAFAYPQHHNAPSWAASFVDSCCDTWDSERDKREWRCSAATVPSSLSLPLLPLRSRRRRRRRLRRLCFSPWKQVLISFAGLLVFPLVWSHRIVGFSLGVERWQKDSTLMVF